MQLAKDVSQKHYAKDKIPEKLGWFHFCSKALP